MHQNSCCDGQGGEYPCTPGVCKRLPTGGDGGIILCHAHFQHEIAFRVDRNRELDEAARFALPAWSDLSVYPENMPKTQAITQLEFEEEDHVKAQEIARRLGYEQTAYTSTSALWGLFCLQENPATWRGARQALTEGCIIKTRELGLMFVQTEEHLETGQ